MVVVLLSLLVFVLIVVVVVCGSVVCCYSCLGVHRPRKTQQKNNKTPCVIVLFCAVVFRGLWPQKGQQPKGKKTANISSWFPRKHFFLQKEALGFVMLSFFVVSLSFFFCLNSGHKTARPLFKLVFERSKKRSQNDQFEGRLGAHKGASSGTTFSAHFGRCTVAL